MNRSISIIIPTLNEASYLPKLLSSLRGQDFIGSVEIIVVDGESDDDTVKVAKGFDHDFHRLVTVVTSADIGHQRNHGVKLASFDLLLFLDADVLLPAGALEAVCRMAGDTEQFVMAVPHRTAAVSLPKAVFGSIVYLLIVVAWVCRFPVTNGDFLLTTKKQHHSIGGFAEGALLGEDTDYGIRAFRNGARYLFCWRTFVIASERRLELMSLRQVLLVWSSAFFHVIRKGPVYDRSRWNYPFGGYRALK